MKFIDFFAGIGGFRLGLELAGHKCVGHCEKDKFANLSYISMHKPKEDEWFEGDITRAKSGEIPRADIWCFGFPCQDISIAGKQRGINGERSSLFYAVIKLLKEQRKENKPQYLFIENVKNLLSINEGWDFTEILCALDEAGYDAEWQVINSSWFVPQNRERIYIIGHSRSGSGRKILPICRESRSSLKKVIDGSQGYRVYSTEGAACTLKSSGGGGGGKTGLYFIDQSKTTPKITANSRCITARYTAGLVNRPAMNSAVLEAYPISSVDRINKRQNGRRVKTNSEDMFTLTVQERHGVIVREATKKGFAIARPGDSINIAFPNSTTRRGRIGHEIAHTLDTQCMQAILDKKLRIRRLTPRECFRLQGFPDELFNRARQVNSDSQLYKQAGNSVTVDVIQAIGLKFND